jgi:hypothetical protein
MENPPPLEIHLAPDIHLSGSISWGVADEDEPALDISVFGGGQTLQGVRLRIAGRRVRVSGLKMDAAGRQAVLLDLVATETIEVKDVVVTNTPAQRQNRGAQQAVIPLALTAAGPAVRALLERVLLLDHRATGALQVGGWGGSSRFTEVILKDSRAAASAMPVISLGEVGVFSAPGTEVMGQGEAVGAMPRTLVSEAPKVTPEDPTRLAA